jgi:hypothetical protein
VWGHLAEGGADGRGGGPVGGGGVGEGGEPERPGPGRRGRHHGPPGRLLPGLLGSLQRLLVPVGGLDEPVQAGLGGPVRLGQRLHLEVEPGHLLSQPGRVGPGLGQGGRAGLARGGPGRDGQAGGERGQAEREHGGSRAEPPPAEPFHGRVVDLRRPHLHGPVGLSLRGASDKERDVTDQHPTVPSWTPQPPPARRPGLGPALVAGLIAVLLLFGGVGLFAARQTAATAQGASSPEAAAEGLLTALGGQNFGRAARYLDAEEAMLVATYRDRAAALLEGRLTGPTGQPLSGLQLTARDVRFQRVTGLGGAEVGVVELTGGTVGGRDARGAKLELPAAELNRRLSDQSKGAVKALRLVAVRGGGDERWRVSLLASLAEQARLAAGAAEPDWGRLAGAGQPAAPGAASPEAAVRDLAAAAGRGQQAALEQLSPAEGRVVAAYRAVLASQGRPSIGGGVRVEGLQTRTEQVADGVARVHATAGRVLAGRPGESHDLRRPAPGDQAPYVVTIQRDGTWYPSLVFTATDWMLHRAERERP